MINIGEQLQNARTAKQLSIEEAAAETKVSASILTGYEHNDFGDNPLTVYTKGHLKLYCQVLELDATALLDALQQQYAGPNSRHIDHETHDNRRHLEAWLLFFKQHVNFTHIALLLLIGVWVTFIIYASHAHSPHTHQVGIEQASKQQSVPTAATTNKHNETSND